MKTVALVSALAALSLASASGVDEVTIVFPARAFPAEKTAAEVLADYLGRATGRRYRTVAEGSADVSRGIYVGFTEFAGRNGFRAEDYADEAWRYREVGGNLVCFGGGRRGGFYAALHFLEDHVGVRWLTPFDDYVPPVRPLDFAGADRNGRPAMPYRSIWDVPNGARFLAFNRMNTPWSPQYGGRRTFGGATDCHTLYTNLGGKDDVEALFKAHPEYFPLLNGRRTFDKRTYGTQLCLTNPDLRRLWAEKLRGRMRAEKEKAAAAGAEPPMYWAIDQNDANDGFCRCEKCVALENREGGVRSALMLDFANNVAAALEDELPPDGMFVMMALSRTAKPPRTLRPHRRLAIRLADVASNMTTPWEDPRNRSQVDYVDSWAAISPAILMWYYSINYGAPAVINHPLPNLHCFAPDFRALLARGGRGVVFEHEEPVAGDMRDLKVWLEIKLLEDPSQDTDELIRAFTDAFYGPAAGAKVREYIALVEAKAQSAKATVTYYPSLSSFAFVDLDAFVRAYAILDGALAAVSCDGELTARVEHAFMSLDRLFLVRAASLRRAASAKGLSLPDEKSVAARYRRVWAREFERRRVTPERANEKGNMSGFFSMLEKRKDVPVPQRFSNVAPDRLFLFNAGLARTFNNATRLKPDPESPVGEGLRISIKDVIDIMTPIRPEAGVENYACPFQAIVWPTKSGNKHVKVEMPECRLPKGYAWYRVGGGFEILPDTVLSLFTGFFVPLEGVVVDPAEIGQKYEIWIHVKVDGPDYFGRLPTAENTIWLDEVAVIREDAGRFGGE